jgi:hypothetical protein
MTLLDVLQNQLPDDALEQISHEIGADKQQTAQAAQGVFATLLGGLAQNASDPNGLQSLGNAIDRDHDGGILDNLSGVLGAVLQGQSQSRATDGVGILEHILGNRQEVAAQQIGQRTGLNMGQVLKLMMTLAPLVMSVLGKTRRQGNVGLGDLGSILNGSARQAQTQTGWGDVLGSVLGGVLGGQGRSEEPSYPQQSRRNDDDDDGGLLSNVLGGIFGRR